MMDSLKNKHLAELEYKNQQLVHQLGTLKKQIVEHSRMHAVVHSCGGNYRILKRSRGELLQGNEERDFAQSLDRLAVKLVHLEEEFKNSRDNSVFHLKQLENLIEARQVQFDEEMRKLEIERSMEIKMLQATISSLKKENHELILFLEQVQRENDMIAKQLQEERVKMIAVNEDLATRFLKQELKELQSKIQDLTIENKMLTSWNIDLLFTNSSSSVNHLVT